MKQTIVELRLSVASKVDAIELLALLQEATNIVSGKESEVAISLVTLLDQKVNVIQASYRERRETD